MRIEIIAIGDELLDGRTRDSNTYYLGGRLRALGATLSRVTIVDDTRDALPDVFREAAARAELVITSGGLGPTLDDRTRDAIAEAMNAPLILFEDVLERIRARFQSLQMEMAELNVRQAMMPEGAIIHPNEKGTADAFETIIDGTPFISLPGVPHEFRHIVEKVLVPRLSDLKVRPAYSFHAFGRGESDLARTIEGLGLDESVKITWSARFPTLTVEMSVDPGQEALLSDAVERVSAVIAPWIYVSDNRSASGAVAQLLTERGGTLATAESCTGGLVASQCTDIAGASQWFQRGYVTYSNDAKSTDLGVDPALIEMVGAVSAEVAEAMATGARQIAETTIAVSITGIAGPGGGSKEKPVGLVYLSCATETEVATLEVHVPGLRRPEFKSFVSEFALVFVLRMLQGRVHELEKIRGVRSLSVNDLR